MNNGTHGFAPKNVVPTENCIDFCAFVQGLCKLVGEHTKLGVVYPQRESDVHTEIDAIDDKA